MPTKEHIELRPHHLVEATRTYLEEFEKSRVAFAYADSALTVLQREFERTADPEIRQRALDELTVASSSAGRFIRRIDERTDNLGAFLNPAPALYPHSNLPAVEHRNSFRVVVGPGSGKTAIFAVIAGASSTSYWDRIRSELQARFNASLRELQPLVGIAYPTLVNLGKRKLHPSTKRAVLQLHSLTNIVIQTRGEDAGREWLSSAGRLILERQGFSAFKAAVVGEPIDITPVGGITFTEEPEPVSAQKIPGEHPIGSRF